MSFAIKRNGDDIEFAELLSWEPHCQNDIESYNPSTSDLQVIEDKGYIVLYDAFYLGEIKMLKIMVGNLLKKVGQLSSFEINRVMSGPLKRFLGKCHKITNKDGTETMNGRITIFGEGKIISMNSFFSALEFYECFDGENVSMQALDECLGGVSAFELIEKLAKRDSKICGNSEYVIQYGSINSGFIAVTNSEGKSIQFSKEEFVCRW